jgi:hypothetical protein
MNKKMNKNILIAIVMLVLFFAVPPSLKGAQGISLDSEIKNQLSTLVQDEEENLTYYEFLKEPIKIKDILRAIIFFFYSAFAFMSIAKKTKTEPAGLAFIPFANLYLISKMANMDWRPILLLLPILFLFAISVFFGITLPIFASLFLMASILLLTIFIIIWEWNIFKRMGRPGWWVLAIIIPVIGQYVFYILLGITAWGKKKELTEKEEA